MTVNLILLLTNSTVLFHKFMIFIEYR